MKTSFTQLRAVVPNTGFAAFLLFLGVRGYRLKEFWIPMRRHGDTQLTGLAARVACVWVILGALCIFYREMAALGAASNDPAERSGAFSLMHLGGVLLVSGFLAQVERLPPGQLEYFHRLWTYWETAMLAGIVLMALGFLLGRLSQSRSQN